MPPPDRRPIREVLAALTVTDRQGWSLLTGATALDEVGERLRRVAALPPLADLSAMPAPVERVPLVVAHGPGLAPALPAIAAQRDRLWVIAPFRSAIALLPAGLVPDVVVLVDRDTWPLHASHEQWRTLSAAQLQCLTTATLVVDAFAPADLVQRWPRAFAVDTGPGAGAAIPLLGSSVLAALAIAFGLGHRHVGLGGADTSPASRLGGLVATLRGADDVRLVDLDAEGLTALLEAGPRLAPRDPSGPPSPGATPAAGARSVAARELDALAALLGEAEAGLAYSPDDPRLVRLTDEIRWRWLTLPAARAAVHRADCRWVTALWELTSAQIRPLHDANSTRMTSRLVLRPLAEALAGHLRDCRACLDRALGPGGPAAVCP